MLENLSPEQRAVLLLHDVLGVAASQGQAGSIIEIGAPMHALLAQLSAARPGQQHVARRIDPGYLAALLRACGQADAVPRGGEPPPRRRAWPSR
jgi:hypothetical protein